MKIGKRKLAGILALALFGVLGFYAPASASTGVDGFTILHASTYQFAHKCLVVGTDNLGHQGVMCADILTAPTSYGQYEAYGQIEAYCQSGSGSTATYVQCAHVDLGGAFSNASGEENTMGFYACGHQYGPCDGMRNEWQSVPFYYSSTTGCDSYPNSRFDVWDVVFGGSAIELPGSDKWIQLYNGEGNDGQNESTGHYYVCW